MDNSNVDNEKKSDITPEVNETNTPSDSSGTLNNNEEIPQLGNGYRPASSNREAFQKGLDDNYNDRIARNKANLQAARARSNHTTKKNEDGEEQNKNFLDKAGDKANLLKNKASLLSSQIDSARAKAFQAMHPVEATKIVAKKKIKAWLLGIIVGSLPLLLSIFVVLVACLSVLGLFDGSDNSDGGIVGGTRECGFTLSTTSLSKEEYKKKIESYASTHPNLEIFANNAYDIYEYAVSKNINPELVPVRAVAEGANNGDGVTGTYNYWGMGCTNDGGAKACFNYNSFEEAYSDFVNLIATYDSLADMMSRYSYIGDYWITLDSYNPSGQGGCYYAKEIYPNNMPLRVQNACATNALSCKMLKNGKIENIENCTATTDEDQQAYMNWQVKQNMANIRFKIFSLKYEDGPCNNVNSDNDIVINSSGPNWSSNAWHVNTNPYSAAGLYGQCTWFAWGRFYEIYGYSPGFLHNGRSCADELLATHPDKFEKSTTPKSGAIFSCDKGFDKNGKRKPGHTGIVMDFDGTYITIQEGNLDSKTNTFEYAKKDWRELKLTLSDWNKKCPNPMIYANPK